jgi:ribonuclease Y
MDSLSILLGLVFGWLLCWGYRAIRLGSFHQTAISIIQHAEREAQKIEHEKKTALSSQETKMREERASLEKEWRILKQERKDLQLENLHLSRTKKALSEKENAAHTATKQAQKQLEAISKLSFEEAKRELWLRAEAEAKKDHEKRLLEWQAIYDKECQARASSLLFCALERKVQALTKETFVTEISIPDKTISKLIGKEGRNIQTLETLLGVNLLIDEAEQKVRISAHDPKRRNLAKATLEQVLSEEKITPVTIKTTYEAICSSFPKILEEKGRDACKILQLEDVPSTILKTLGELSLRTSCGQNALLHSIEVAELMGIAALELGFYAEKAKFIGLCHDIGKAIPLKWGESHAVAGSKFLASCGVEDEICQAIASHHGESKMTSYEARLLPICDRLSALLPGSRRDQDPLFLEMVHQCEQVATNMPGILSAWAHYGGSHIELVVRPEPQMETQPLVTSLEKTFATLNLRFPVKVTLIPEKCSFIPRQS